MLSLEKKIERARTDYSRATAVQPVSGTAKDPGFKGWSTFLVFLFFSALEIGILIYDPSTFVNRSDRIIVAGAVFFPIMALFSFPPIFRWLNQTRVVRAIDRIDRAAATLFANLFRYVVLVLIALVAAVLLGFALFSAFGWLSTIPSWAAVIIILLFLIYLKFPIAKGAVGMKIGKALTGLFARRAIKNNPVLSACHLTSERLISELKQNGFDESLVRGWAEQTFAHLLAALQSPDPRIAIRKLLVEWALLDSDYCVMMIPRPPAPDQSGMRGLQGISGGLWEHRLELARVYEPIKDMLHAASLEVNETTVHDAILTLASQAAYLMNMANTARVALDDYHHDTDKDWFRPMRYSFCVMAENNLRKLIKLPTTPDEDMAAMIHVTMMTTVLVGSRFPDVKWREDHQEQIKRGLLCLPAFKAGARLSSDRQHA
jgi:hypothetical protein